MPRVYSSGFIGAMREQHRSKLKRTLIKSLHSVDVVDVASANYRVMAGRVEEALRQGSKEGADRAVSDAIVFLRGLRTKMVASLEHIADAETALLSHADFETLVFNLEREPSDPVVAINTPNPSGKLEYITTTTELKNSGEDSEFE